MRFTLIAAVAACRSLALRPHVGRASAISEVGNLASTITSMATDSLAAMKAAAGIVNDIFVDTGNATDHLSSEDQNVLRSVLSLVDDTIYSSMDDSHNADVSSLQGGVDTAALCNTLIAERQAPPDGDLWKVKEALSDEQTTLNYLRDSEDEMRQINNTKWADFDNHMQWISPPPACPGFPAKTMANLDVYFGESPYVNWYETQKDLYDASRLAFETADLALQQAVIAYNTHKDVFDVMYCDYKLELVAACVAFDNCFDQASNQYTNQLSPQVQEDMDGRIQVKTAGDTLTHQIQFILGDVTDQQTPPVDTSRYEITFPDLPPKGLCDLSPLDDAQWGPVPSCGIEEAEEDAEDADEDAP